MSRRQVHQSYSGCWEFPGGKIEENENSEVTLKRELLEELGIEVTSYLFWAQYYHAYTDRKVQLTAYQIIDFLNEPISKEGQLLCWVTLDEIQKLNILAGSQFIIGQLTQAR